MTFRFWRFNSYLALALAAAVVTGCLSADPERKKAREEKKQRSSLRIHLEANAVGTQLKDPVPVFRENPTLVYINRNPFLTENHVNNARVLDVMGTVAIQIEFNHAGLFLLEQYTTANKGSRMVIFSQFGEAKDAVRWLAAPLIRQRIADGVLVFTPDASREEAERIVRGLNNLVAKNKKKGL